MLILSLDSGIHSQVHPLQKEKRKEKMLVCKYHKQNVRQQIKNNSASSQCGNS